MTIGKTTTSFDAIASKVQAIAATENTYAVADSQEALSSVGLLLPDGGFEVDSARFTQNGFTRYAQRTGFGSAASFVWGDLMKNHSELANGIVRAKTEDYFRNKNAAPFIIREFEDKIQGVVSNRYSQFDDREVIDIIGNSHIADLEFHNPLISAERFHVRAVEHEPFKIAGDDSPLFFAYFIDNSMVGGCSFRVQLGIYRLVCTNGLIVPVKDFVICKRVHFGKKDIAAEFTDAVAFLSEKRDAIRSSIAEAAVTRSRIEDMMEDFQSEYLMKRLNIGEKAATTILMLYKHTYGGGTKWALTNAITEYARDLEDITKRETLERLALKVA